MEIHRRRFIRDAGLGAAALALAGCGLMGGRRSQTPGRGIRIGGCDWSLRKEGDPDSFALARDAGLEGVEVSLGKGEERLPLADPERRKPFLEAAAKHRLAIPSTCLEVLHRDGLKRRDVPRAAGWVEQSIEATRALGARVILLPFFGKQAIKEREEQKVVAERLKPIAPAAEKAGVVLALENTISAEDNAWILDQVGSSAVQVYYDVGNSAGQGFDIYREIPWLGKDRICQLHLKDRQSLLGMGQIDFPRLVNSILESRFEGWAMLETAVVTSVKEDFAANAAFVRGLLAEKSLTG